MTGATMVTTPNDWMPFAADTTHVLYKRDGFPGVTTRRRPKDQAPVLVEMLDPDPSPTTDQADRTALPNTRSRLVGWWRRPRNQGAPMTTSTLPTPQQLAERVAAVEAQQERIMGTLEHLSATLRSLAECLGQFIPDDASAVAQEAHTGGGF